jgi:hypothetical protein
VHLLAGRDRAVRGRSELGDVSMIEVPPGYLWNNTGRSLVICLRCGVMVSLLYVREHDTFHEEGC